MPYTFQVMREGKEEGRKKEEERKKKKKKNKIEISAFDFLYNEEK